MLSRVTVFATVLGGASVLLGPASFAFALIDIGPYITTTSITSVDHGGPIPMTAPDEANGDAIFTFNVDNAGHYLSDLDIRLAIYHVNPVVVSMILRTPSGQETYIYNHFDVPSEPGVNFFQDVVIDDDAPATLDLVSIPFEDAYRLPVGYSLDVYEDVDPNGVWTLIVSNDRSPYGYLYKQGEPVTDPQSFPSPWQGLIGTQLIITARSPIPEPLSATTAFLGISALGAAVLRRR